MLNLNSKQYKFKLTSRKKGRLRFEIQVEGPSDPLIFDLTNLLYEAEQVLYDKETHYVSDYGTTYRFLSQTYFFWIEIEAN